MNAGFKKKEVYQRVSIFTDLNYNNPIFQSSVSILGETKNDKKGNLRKPKRTTPEGKTAQVFIGSANTRVPLAEALVVCIVALARGDRYRRCIPIQGRQLSKSLVWPAVRCVTSPAHIKAGCFARQVAWCFLP